MELGRDELRHQVVSDPETLHELLARLNDPDDRRILSRPEEITVEDIAEALGLDPNYVAKELEEIYEEHRIAKLSGVLRELEEPLYRVERPGHSVEPSGENPFSKMRSVQILAERNKSKPVVPRRVETGRDEMVAKWIGYFVLGGMTLMTAILIAKVVLAGN